MAQQRDVIVSAYATPPRDDIRAMAHDLSLFESQPYILDVPYHQWMKPEDRGMAAGPFSRAADAFRRPSGSILEGLFERYLPNIEPRSVALVTFSGGNSFLNKVIKSEKDRDWIDSIIVLDGLAFNKDWQGNPIPQEYNPWLQFARAAADDRRLMVLAHTHIAPLSTRVTSTQVAAEFMLRRLEELAPAPRVPSTALDWDLLDAGPPPPAVTITGGNPRQTRTYDGPPLAALDEIGNFWSLDYGGTGPTDHIYVAWYAQRDVWRCFLAPRWNAGIGCRMPALAGLGQSQYECEANRVIIPPGTYPTGSFWLQLGATVGGLALGTAAGYLFGRALES